MGSSAIPRFWSAPPGLYSGQDEDPIAALIGKGLQAFGAVRSARQQEQDRQQRLQREDTQERDTANWRNLQTGIQLAGAGLTTKEPPAGPSTFEGPTFSSRPGLDSEIGETPKLAPGAPAQPIVSVGGQNLYRAAPSAAEQKATVTDERARVIHRRVGHALAQQMGWETPGKPVDDDTAEGIGTNPAPFASFQRTQEDAVPHVNDDGTVSWIAKKPPSAGQTGVRGAPVQPKISEKQRADAGDAIAMQSAHADLSQMENTNTGAVGEVARWVATPSIGRLIPGSVGAGVVDILRQARSAGLSDPAQAYLKRMFDFSSLAGPARYGRRFGSEIALQQIWNDFGAAQLGVGQEGIRATQKNRANAVRSRRTAAGESAWNEAQRVPMEEGGESPMPPPRINPRFDPRQRP